MRGQRVLFMVRPLSEADSNPFLDTYSWCCSVGLPATGSMQHSSSFVVAVVVVVSVCESATESADQVKKKTKTTTTTTNKQ